MHHSDAEFGRSARWALDDNLHNISPARTERLAEMRSADLPAQSHLALYRLAGLLTNLRVFRFSYLSASFNPTRLWSMLAGAVLLLGLVQIYDTTLHQHIHETAEIDAMVLTDELPLSAYLEQGFNSFLDLLDEE